MTSKPKGQHYVPACYLREWLDPSVPEKHQPFVWIFDKDGKNKKRKAPENILKNTDLYTLKLPGKENDYTVEETLSKLEGRYASIFRTKIKKRLPLTDEEHVVLCAFTYAMLHRTLPFKQNIESFLTDVLAKVTSLEEAHGVQSKTGDELREYSQNAHSSSLVSLLPEITANLAQMSVAFICAPRIGPRFITSDNPCFLFNSEMQWQRFYGTGIGQKNTQVMLPLSTEILLCLSWSNYKGYIQTNSSWVADLNRMVRGHAHEHIVSHTPKTKLIWFSPLPLDLMFILKFLKKKSQSLLARLLRKIRS